MQQQLAASGTITGKETASISGSNSFTETISAMAGRTAGVVALRDGLYKACEAYANGVIGKSAYALILSQYGNLLVALAGSSGGGSSGGGSGGGGGGGGSSTSTPAGVAVAVSTGSGGQSAAPTPAKDSGSGGGGGSTAGSAQVAQMQQQILQALMVACVSGSDPTVQSGAAAGPNPLLSDACAKLVGKIVDATPGLLSLAGGSSGAGKGGGGGGGKPETPDPTIMAVQKALGISPADGLEGPITKMAVSAYQKGKGLTVNGNPKDPDTVKDLGLNAGKGA